MKIRQAKKIMDRWVFGETKHWRIGTFDKAVDLCNWYIFKRERRKNE